MTPDQIRQPDDERFGHPVVDSDDFRAGMAYAAHILRHAVNLAHGHSGYIPPWVERNTCCRSAILGFAEGMAQGFDKTAGPVVNHEHAEGGAR